MKHRSALRSAYPQPRVASDVYAREGKNGGVADPTWTDVVTALGSAVTPLVVVGAGLFLARRQSRSDELVRVRIDYYRKLVPDLNRLMCYMTFIGPWRDITPVEIVELKRRLDAEFYCAAPLFSREVGAAYDKLMSLSFKTFGKWGADARILSGSYRRQKSWIRKDEDWDPAWDEMFAFDVRASIPATELAAYRRAYDDLLARLVADLNINAIRTDYTTARVSLNASAPPTRTVEAAPPTGD